MTGKTERGCLRTMKPLDEFYFNCVDYIKRHYKLDEDVAYNIVDDALIYELENYPDMAEIALMHKAEQLAQNYIRDCKTKRNYYSEEPFLFDNSEGSEYLENFKIRKNTDDYSLVEFNEWFETIDETDKSICKYRARGYTSTEIGKMLGISKQAVSKRLKKLRQSVDE